LKHVQNQCKRPTPNPKQNFMPMFLTVTTTPDVVTCTTNNIQ